MLLKVSLGKEQMGAEQYVGYCIHTSTVLSASLYIHTASPPVHEAAQGPFRDVCYHSSA